MADITHNDPVVTESKLTEFYNDIKPFLGCPAYVTQEGDAEYYSTDEKVVGRWTDGKPLYKKVIYFSPQITITANSWQNIKSDETDIEYIVDAIILRSDGVFIPQYGSVSPFIGTRGLWVYTTQLQNAIQGIILKYTKTTDSATTTIQEDPNEYSTDEKIIGKWIDGKPLYQKTIVGTTAATAYSWVQIPIGANIDFSMLKDLTILAGGAGVAANAAVDFFYPSVGEDLSTYARAVIWTDREGSASKNCFGVYTKFNGSVPFYATIQYTKVSD